MQLAIGPLLIVPLLAALLHAVRQENLPRRRVLKPICSLTFLLTAFLAAPLQLANVWVYAGLALSLAGDVFLLGEDRRAFALGLVAFLAAHVCYMAWMFPLVAFQELPWTSGLLALPYLLAGGWILRAGWGELGSLKLGAVIYFCALTLLAWSALVAWLALAPSSRPAALRGLGLTLFFISE